MFDIEYKGGNTVIISTKKSRLISDPKLSVVGLKDVDTKAAVTISTETRFAVGSPDALLNIDGPGEYEVSEFSIRGVAVQRHLDTETDPKIATIYRVEIGDVRIAVIGNIDEKLTEEQLEDLGVVDVVIVPVGGNGYTLDATSATRVVRAIDAKVVIPVHYADSGLKYEVPQDSLELFTKEIGGEIESIARYKVKSVSALPQTMTVIELTRS